MSLLLFSLSLLLVASIAIPMTDRRCSDNGCYIFAHPDDATGQRVPAIPPPTVWIGNEFAARNLVWLAEANITHVLSLIPVGSPRLDGLTYKSIPVQDHWSQPMISVIRETHEWISALPAGSAVLVHCAAGVSRSATVVLGHMLLANQTLTLDTALELLRQERSVVDPNPGFMRDLVKIEEGRAAERGREKVVLL